MLNGAGRDSSKEDLWKATVEWSDWKIFSKHSFYLLIAGYFGVADQQVNTILISNMGTVDMAGNSLIGANIQHSTFNMSGTKQNTAACRAVLLCSVCVCSFMVALVEDC
jgi:hypothetical protein